MAYENDKEFQRMLESSGLKKAKAKRRMKKAASAPSEDKPKKRIFASGFLKNYLGKKVD